MKLIYILVHGGDRDGSIWNEVAEILRAKGNTVYCPSMKSVTKATLKENIDEIIEMIKSNGIDKAILCGHSYGAMVITGVFEQLPDIIEQLVFIDSVVPENGKSLYGLLEKYGLNYKEFGLTPDPACLEPLFFNEKRLSSVTKSYVHCLQSEFIAITKPIYEKIKTSHDNWLYFCLDTTHGCMFTQPKELATILAGLVCFFKPKS